MISQLELILLIILGSITLLSAIIITILLQRKPQGLSEYSGRNQQEILSKIENLKAEVKSELELINLKSKSEIKDELNTFKEAVSTKLNTDLSQMNEKVENRLKAGFQSNDELFKNMVERLVAIDHTQKNIEKLSLNVEDLKRYLSDKKTRGIYGEVQLYNILDNVFGENNKTLYDKQQKLSNGHIVDALIYGHDGIGHIPIDSKFSLENYILMQDEKQSEATRLQATKLFESNIKKHIDDISSKYIILNETTDYALMFIPSEAVFTEIQANFLHLVEYGQKKRVWLTSPTTLIYMVTMILIMGKNIEKEKHAETMLKELKNLFNDFRLFFERWKNLKKQLDKLSEVVSLVEKPMGRLNQKVYHIEASEFEELQKED